MENQELRLKVLTIEFACWLCFLPSVKTQRCCVGFSRALQLITLPEMRGFHSFVKLFMRRLALPRAGRSINCVWIRTLTLRSRTGLIRQKLTADYVNENCDRLSLTS